MQYKIPPLCPNSSKNRIFYLLPPEFKKNQKQYNINPVFIFEYLHIVSVSTNAQKMKYKNKFLN